MFEIFKDSKGKIRFRLKARNGKIIAVSEAYNNKRNCLKGINSVITNVPKASIKNLIKE